MLKENGAQKLLVLRMTRSQASYDKVRARAEEIIGCVPGSLDLRKAEVTSITELCVEQLSRLREPLVDHAQVAPHARRRIIPGIGNALKKITARGAYFGGGGDGIDSFAPSAQQGFSARVLIPASSRGFWNPFRSGKTELFHGHTPRADTNTPHKSQRTQLFTDSPLARKANMDPMEC